MEYLVVLLLGCVTGRAAQTWLRRQLSLLHICLVLLLLLIVLMGTQLDRSTLQIGLFLRAIGLVALQVVCCSALARLFFSSIHD